MLYAPQTVGLRRLFPQKERFSREKIGSIEVDTARNVTDVLEDTECVLVDTVLTYFANWSGKKVTRDMLLEDDALRTQVGYFTYMLYTHGVLRLPEDDIHDLEEKNKLHQGQLLFGAIFFKWFKHDSKDIFKEKYAGESPMSFIDRMFPMIEYKLGTLVETDKVLLRNMYELIKEKFQGKTRSIKAYDGRSITYLTHLKEVMLSILFFSGEVSVTKLLIAMGHDLLEDTDVTIEALKDLFGPEVAFGIQQLSKLPLDTYLQEEVLDDTVLLHSFFPKSYTIGDQLKKSLCMQSLEKYRKWNKKRKEQQSQGEHTEPLPEDAVLGEKFYKWANTQVREEYYNRLESFTQEKNTFIQQGRVYFDPETLEVCTATIPGALSLAVQDLIEIKCEDVNNNLATMHDDFHHDKINRKLFEAQVCIMPLMNTYSVESPQIATMKYWIAYWDRYLSKRGK